MISPRIYSRLWTLLAITALVACNLPRGTSSGSSAPNGTQTYQTVAARLTASPAAAPATNTSTPTNSGAATVPAATLSASATPSGPAKPPTETRPCDQAAPGSPIFDVSIPDDSKLNPGQSFTKTWRLQNAGVCTWTEAYAVTFFSGERLSAPQQVPLRGAVAPGQTVDISVDMLAPQAPGTYQGNWKLRNAANGLFGIGPNGSAPFWVRIVVIVVATATPTAGTVTPTRTATPTMAVQANAALTLGPGALVDLDNNRINAESGNDLSYESDADGRHLLVPQPGVKIGVFGASQPDLVGCKNASLSSDPVDVETVPDTYLCYHTSQGLPGRVIITGLNADTYNLSINFLTWSLP